MIKGLRGMRRSAAVIVAATTFASAPASAIVLVGASSTFDTDAEGWQFVDVPGNAASTADFVTLLGGPSAVDYVSSGGNPGGYISAQDPSNNTFFFTAPAPFLGNQSLVYGGVLKFDFKVTPATPEWTGDPDVVLISESGVLVYDIGTQPGAAFSSRVVPWSEAGWRVGSLSGAQATQAQFQNVIGNLGALLIAGEFIASSPGTATSFEVASIDNVMLTPVPEPSAALLMSLGVLGIGAACRRKRAGSN